MTEKITIVKDFTSSAFVRHPFVRVVSAFIDKIVDNLKSANLLDFNQFFPDISLTPNHCRSKGASNYLVCDFHPPPTPHRAIVITTVINLQGGGKNEGVGL